MLDIGDVVEVDQGQAPYPAARQGFGGPGTDTANADHHHVRIEDALRADVAIQAAQATEAALKIGIVHAETGGGSWLRYLRRPRRSRAAVAASLRGWALTSSSSVRLAALLSLSSCWQLAMASRASGTRG